MPMVLWAFWFWFLRHLKRPGLSKRVSLGVYMVIAVYGWVIILCVVLSLCRSTANNFKRKLREHGNGLWRYRFLPSSPYPFSSVILKTQATQSSDSSSMLTVAHVKFG